MLKCLIFKRVPDLLASSGKPRYMPLNTNDDSDAEIDHDKFINQNGNNNDQYMMKQDVNLMHFSVCLVLLSLKLLFYCILRECLKNKTLI